MAKGKMKDEDFEALRSNHEYLQHNLTAKDLVGLLFQHQLFDEDDMCEIRAAEGTGRRRGMEKFLELLFRAGYDSFPIFIKCLREGGYTQAANKLEISRAEIVERNKQIEAEKLQESAKIERYVSPEVKCTPTRGSMPDKHVKILRKNHVFLIDELKASYIMNTMYEDMILDMNDMSEIEAAEKNGHHHGMSKLLAILHRSGIDAYPKFLNCLAKTGYEHVRKCLEETICEH